MKHAVRKKRASALIVVIMLVTVMLFIMLSLISVSVIQLKIGASVSTTNVTYQVADAGVEEVLKVIKKDAFDPAKNISQLASEGLGASCVNVGGKAQIKKNFVSGDPSKGAYFLTFYDDEDPMAASALNCSDDVADIVVVKAKGVYGNNGRVVRVVAND